MLLSIAAPIFLSRSAGSIRKYNAARDATGLSIAKQDIILQGTGREGARERDGWKENEGRSLWRNKGGGQGRKVRVESKTKSKRRRRADGGRKENNYKERG